MPTKHIQIGEYVVRNRVMNSVRTEVDPWVKDALDHVRAAAQELHVAVSNAAAKRAGATKADLEDLAQKANAVTESAKAAFSPQNEAAKRHLTEAVTQLEATQKHIAEGLKTSGNAFQTSIKKAVTDAQAAVQKVSEAIAAKRSAASTNKPN